MSLLNKFIDSLQIRFFGSAFREVIHPFAFQGRMEQHNVIYMLNKATCRWVRMLFPFRRVISISSLPDNNIS